MDTHFHRIGAQFDDRIQPTRSSGSERLQGELDCGGVMGKVIDYTYAVDFRDHLLPSFDTAELP